MKLINLLAALLLAIAIPSFSYADAGKSPVPKEVKLDKAEDYARYKPDVLRCINYLRTTPLSQDEDVRKSVNAFVTMWIAGSPDVSITIREYIMDFVGEQPEILMLFMAGYTEYAIQNANATELGGNLAGLKLVLDFYEGDMGLKKTAKLDDLAMMYKSGKLPSYVERQLKERK